MYRDAGTHRLVFETDEDKDAYLALVLPIAEGFKPWTKKGATNEETDLVLAQKARPRHPGEGLNGTSSTSGHAA